jgi:hypothetical protein
MILMKIKIKIKFIKWLIIYYFIFLLFFWQLKLVVKKFNLILILNIIKFPIINLKINFA